MFLFDADLKAPLWAEVRVRAVRHTQNMIANGLPYLWEKVRSRSARYRARRKSTGGICELPTGEPAISNGEVSWRVLQRIWDYSLRGYRPRPLDAAGVLFRPQVNCYGDIHDHDGCLGWRGYFSQGLTEIEVAGDHISMWKEPDVRVLTQAWQDSLGQLACLSA